MHDEIGQNYYHYLSFHKYNLELHIRRGVNVCLTPLLMCNPRFHISNLGLHIKRGVNPLLM